MLAAGDSVCNFTSWQALTSFSLAVPHCHGSMTKHSGWKFLEQTSEESVGTSQSIRFHFTALIHCAHIPSILGNHSPFQPLLYIQWWHTFLSLLVEQIICFYRARTNDNISSDCVQYNSYTVYILQHKARCDVFWCCFRTEPATL